MTVVQWYAAVHTIFIRYSSSVFKETARFKEPERTGVRTEIVNRIIHNLHPGVQIGGGGGPGEGPHTNQSSALVRAQPFHTLH